MHSAFPTPCTRRAARPTYQLQYFLVCNWNFVLGRIPPQFLSSSMAPSRCREWGRNCILHHPERCFYLFYVSHWSQKSLFNYKDEKTMWTFSCSYVHPANLTVSCSSGRATGLFSSVQKLTVWQIVFIFNQLHHTYISGIWNCFMTKHISYLKFTYSKFFAYIFMFCSLYLKKAALLIKVVFLLLIILCLKSLFLVWLTMIRFSILKTRHIFRLALE